LIENNGPERETAILVGVQTKGTFRWKVEDALDELELLADTAGATVTDRILQALPALSPSTFIGRGKVEELKELVGRRRSDLVIFDDDLSPVQVRNLERRLNCKLLDRTGLILDIFADRAKTATAKTQVELAQLEYLRTRLTRQWTHLSRQKGGIGTKGPGETQIETDRQLIGKRIAVLRERLDRIDRQRTTQRKGRTGEVRASLVGYTNSGKSTLLNALTDASVLAENRLFATLDSTTRRVELIPQHHVLLTDTVGFIRKLPHGLIESFKSTLDEVRESDLLLHVIDISHPAFEDQIAIVDRTLAELGSGEKPVLEVFNKVDTLEDRSLLASIRERHQDAVFVSAARGIGIQDLKEAAMTLITSDRIEFLAYIPVSDYGAISHIRSRAKMLAEDYVAVEDGVNSEQTAVRLRFSIPKKFEGDIRKLLARFKDVRPVLEVETD
jgi:GTP-binding protein HflX